MARSVLAILGIVYITTIVVFVAFGEIAIWGPERDKIYAQATTPAQVCRNYCEPKCESDFRISLLTDASATCASLWGISCDKIEIDVHALLEAIPEHCDAQCEQDCESVSGGVLLAGSR